MSTSAQKVQENIDKAIKDPKREVNAAKADVYIHKKKRIISDTAQLPPSSATENKNTKKSCSHKSKS